MSPNCSERMDCDESSALVLLGKDSRNYSCNKKSYFQRLCFLDLIKFVFVLVVIRLFDQSLGLHNGIIGDQTLTYWRSLIICKSQGNDPDADN